MNNRIKRVISFVLCLMIGCVAQISVLAMTDAIPAGYTAIYTVQDLKAISNYPNRNYILMADLDIAGSGIENWTPLCTKANPFSGDFDGNGHVIENLKTQNTTYSTGESGAKEITIGLFRKITGCVHDLTLENVDIRKNNAEYLGALAGICSGTIRNVSATGTITASLDRNGYCYTSSSQITQITSVGGLIGYQTDGIIEKCRSHVAINTKCGRGKDEVKNYVLFPSVGGIVGAALGNAVITQCFNTGNINALNEEMNTSYWGVKIIAVTSGIVGDLCGAAAIDNCYNLGDINSTVRARNHADSYVNENGKNCLAYNYVAGIANGYSTDNGAAVRRCVNLGYVDETTWSAHTEPFKIISGISFSLNGLDTCYYLNNAAPQGAYGYSDKSVGVTPLTKEQMADKNSFPKLDFKSIWFIDTNASKKHPQLMQYPEGDPHTHTYVPIVVDPTCLEQGYTVWSCLGCCNDYIENYTDPIGHSFSSWQLTTPPTEYSFGQETKTCERCGFAETRSVEKLPRTELTLNKTSIYLTYKESDVLTASEPVIWTSSNEKVVKVDTNGKLTTIGKGTATITANSVQGGKTATCQVSVKYTFVQILIRIFLFGFLWY